MASGKIFRSSPGGTCVETETGHAFGMDGGAILAARRHGSIRLHKTHPLAAANPPKNGKEWTPPNGETLGTFLGGEYPMEMLYTPVHLQKKIRRVLQINWFLQILYSKHPQKPMNGYQKKDGSGKVISGFTTWPEILGLFLLKFQGCNPSLNVQVQKYMSFIEGLVVWLSYPIKKSLL